MVSQLRERTDKPHIFFRDGYWRVNLSGYGTYNRLKPWNKAHAFINPWNTLQSTYLRLNYPFYRSECECTEVDYCDNCLRKMSRDNRSANASPQCS